MSFDQGTAKYPLYASALVAAGKRFGYSVEPVWLAGTNRAFDRAALESVDGIVLTGGADVDPRRYGFADPDGLCNFALPERDVAELPVVEEIFRRKLPTLAICRGMQFLNVVRGGSLIPDLPNHEGDDDSKRHNVRLDANSRLAQIAGRAEAPASTAHHQAVDRPGDGLRIVAAAADGVAEGIEWIDPSDKPWLVAVQWHPERMNLNEPLAGLLYQAFLGAVSTKAALSNEPLHTQ